MRRRPRLPAALFGPRAYGTSFVGTRRSSGRWASSLHLPRRDEGARRVGPPLRRLEPAPAAGARRRRGLVWCPRDGFTASVDPGPAAGVLAPPSLLRPRREAPRAFATPRRSSLRSPASAPGSTLSRQATSRTPHYHGGRARRTRGP